MSSRPTSVRAVAAWGLGVATALAVGVALACGPFLEPRLLFQSDDVVVAAPRVIFGKELERLKPADPPRFVPPALPGDPRGQTLWADVDDLETALDRAGLAAPARDALLADYKAARARLSRVEVKKAADAGPVPGGLPPEFADYLRGAMAYHAGRLDEARQAWQAVLARPAEERPFRSTWAAFMLGRSLLESDPGEAVSWFARLRELAGAGFADSLGLAAASVGWEARAELGRGGYERATELYLTQLATGDDTAVTSLELTASRIVTAGVLARAAAHPQARQLVTAYVLSRGESSPSRPGTWSARLAEQWLDALEQTQGTGVADADRLAAVAYQSGDLARTARWLAVAPPDSPIGGWLRAKLLLRDGKLDAAAAQLAQVSHSFPRLARSSALQEDWYIEYDDYEILRPASEAIRIEAGILQLARRQYVEALDALLRARLWTDTAYVAERVLTPGELTAYVDRDWPPTAVQEPKAGERSWWPSQTPERLGARLRHLLARRLARLGRFADARAYMPARFVTDLDAYAAALEAGRDRRRPADGPDSRAVALWQAARIARESGMELLGTELSPDAYVYEGNFDIEAGGVDAKSRAKGPLTAASADEQARAARHLLRPERRFHYRFVAADLAWRAAALMPDQDPRTAKVLWSAGSWLKERAPKDADRFYKALVRRCGRTPLGQEADRLRWFPAVDPADGARPEP
jgi:hypothetical protein